MLTNIAVETSNKQQPAFFAHSSAFIYEPTNPLPATTTSLTKNNLRFCTTTNFIAFCIKPTNKPFS